MGLLGCVGAWGSGFVGLGIVWGLGGLVFGLCGVMLGLCGVGFRNMIFGLGVKEIGLAGWRV